MSREKNKVDPKSPIQREYFVALLIAGIALLVPNMSWAFGIGIVTDLFIRRMKIKIWIQET